MARAHPALAVHGALSRGAFAVAVLVSLAVLFAPADDVPMAPPGVDKLVHLLLFAALAASGRWAGVRAGVLAGSLVVYAAVSEVVQGLCAAAVGVRRRLGRRRRGRPGRPPRVGVGRTAHPRLTAGLPCIAGRCRET